MDNTQLKLAVADDIRTIKHLDPDIIPARVYYGDFFKIMLAIFWSIFVVISSTLTYSFTFNTQFKTPATYSEIISSSVIVAFFLSLGALIVLWNSVNFFVLFRLHLETKLKTGVLLVKKFKLIAKVFLGFFVFFCTVFGSYGEDTQILLMLGFAFFGSLAATYFLVSMELSRIGISTIFTVINEFFHKEKRIDLLLR
ncbi:hypothetical protein [Fluoribacter dumoffii]|uniref:hypothetical protein n=1 Tax=Fluoribacter dumoffii TaxID=463 RepID=UPI00026C7713|nr:hypothetical protein [Fluoribacter dumoffii]